MANAAKPTTKTWFFARAFWRSASPVVGRLASGCARAPRRHALATQRPPAVTPHVNHDDHADQAHHAAQDQDDHAAKHFVQDRGKHEQASDGVIYRVQNLTLDGRERAEDEAGKDHDPQHHQACAVGRAGGGRAHIENAPPEQQPGPEHARIHHIADRHAQQRRVVIGRVLPHIERGDVERGHHDGAGQPREAPLRHAMALRRCLGLAARNWETAHQHGLRRREHDQHRPHHVEQQILNLVHEEGVSGHVVDRRGQSEKDRKDAGQEGRMAQELTALLEGATADDAGKIDEADQDRGDHDDWRNGPDIPSAGVVMRLSGSPSRLARGEVCKPRKRANKVPTLT